jgi:hypothetical protein
MRDETDHHVRTRLLGLRGCGRSVMRARCPCRQCRKDRRAIKSRRVELSQIIERELAR